MTPEQEAQLLRLTTLYANWRHAVAIGPLYINPRSRPVLPEYELWLAAHKDSDEVVRKAFKRAFLPPFRR